MQQPDHVTLQRLRQICEPLLLWYSQNARTLPWRSDPAPYHVWVSEIMLQQTRVEAVKPYYERFLHALPDIRALAECPEEDLLKLWEGLGYYSRARNLQKTAKICVDTNDARLPDRYEELLKLPGIGPYTAGAIASIAFQRPQPAVDGNVLRILSRVLEKEEDILDPKVRKLFEGLLREVIPEEKPGDFNQALMDLGAGICLPGAAPRCAECPLQALCLANAHGSAGRIPVRGRAKERRIEQRIVLVIRDGLKVLLVKRPSRGLLAGMYEFPCMDRAALPEGKPEDEQVIQRVQALGLSPARLAPLGEAKHLFSHIEWKMTGYMVLVEELQLTDALEEQFPQGFVLADLEEIRDRIPVPSAYAAYVKALHIRPD